MERLSNTETRDDCAAGGDHRIVDGYHPHRIPTELFVVECEPKDRDGDEQQQAGDAGRVDISLVWMR